MSDELNFEYRAVIVSGETTATLTQDGWTCSDALFTDELNIRFNPAYAPPHSDRFAWAVESAAVWMRATIAEQPPLDFTAGKVY